MLFAPSTKKGVAFNLQSTSMYIQIKRLESVITKFWWFFYLCATLLADLGIKWKTKYPLTLLNNFEGHFSYIFMNNLFTLVINFKMLKDIKWQ